MNEHQTGAHQPRQFDRTQHREIGLRAVAAAVIYNSRAKRPVSGQMTAPTAGTAPSDDHDA